MFNFITGNSEQCCDTLELALNYPNMNDLEKELGNPGGKYKKKDLIWNDMIVYYNTENHFYLYNGGFNRSWVVSILQQKYLLSI